MRVPLVVVPTTYHKVYEEELVKAGSTHLLEQARRNMDEADVIRVLDDEFGHVVFQSITKEDLSAKGTLRPVGARHFAAKANLVQTINGLYLSGMGADPEVMKFTSSLDTDKVLAKYDCLSSKIHVEMLSKCGFVSGDEKKELLDAQLADIL